VGGEEKVMNEGKRNGTVDVIENEVREGRVVRRREGCIKVCGKGKSSLWAVVPDMFKSLTVVKFL
jgi:hypothetical protein